MSRLGGTLFGPAPGACPPSTCFFVEVEALLWRISKGPMAAPLVTTGSLLDPTPGALGQPGTAIVSGGAVKYDSLPGVRATAGGWFDPEHTFGAELSGFSLFKDTQRRTYAPDAQGNPSLYVPLIRPDLVPPGEGTLVLNEPQTGVTGSLSESSTVRLWGAEANALWGLGRSERGWAELLAGVRYLNLSETLTIVGASGVPAVDDFLTFSDQFATRNHFYGGQVGARGKLFLGRFDVLAQAKIAAGITNQEVSVSGVSVNTGAGAINPGVNPGGVFAQASNSGKRTRTEFSIVPQVGLQVGWNVTQRLRVFAGYDVLYWTNVVRPGDQIDRNVSLTPGTVPPAPQPRFKSSDFWAHGASIGLGFQF